MQLTVMPKTLNLATFVLTTDETDKTDYFTSAAYALVG